MGTEELEEVRPAFYALRRGGWRDYVTLLHPPYTLWHLSYVAVGAALAPRFHLDRMLWAIAAFFLAMGVAAHALDELQGRPLRTQIPGRALVAIAVGEPRRRGRDRHRRRGSVGLGPARLRGASARCSSRRTTSRLALPHELGLRALLGRVPGADRATSSKLRRSASRRSPRPAYAIALSLAQRALSTPVRERARAVARRRRERSRSNARCACSSWAAVLIAVALVAARLR